MSGLTAQSLAQHEWNDRLVLLLVEDEENEVFQEQLRAFRKEADGMQDRKLVIYQIKPNAYKIGLKAAKEWKTVTTAYSSYKKSTAPFELLLIGLDGGIKLRQNTFLSTEDLFAIIDGMPMRRAELRRRKPKG